MVATNSSVETQKLTSPSLSTWGQTVLLLLIAIGAYFQTWVDIWPYWENKNATYTHGTLVALVAVWLVWRKRSTVNQIEPKPSVRALPVILLLSVVWMLAEGGNVFIVYATLWPIIAFAALWAGLGLPAASRLAFPLGFLYFAIPIWEYLKPPLQAITITMADFLTSVFGIPAAFDGPYVTLPTGTILIAEDCSGAHFLSVALAVGVLAGVLRRDVLRTRLLILVVAGVLSLVFNWLRILLIVLAYLHPDLRHALETIGHLTFGWWVFALDLVVFGLVLRFVPRSANEQRERPPPVPTQTMRSNNNAALWTTAIALVLLPTIAWVVPRTDTYPTETSGTDLRIVTTDEEILSPDLLWTPHFPGAAWEHRFAIRTDSGIAIEVYRNQYHEQSQGRELVSRGSQLFDAMYFSSESTSNIDLLDSDGRSIQALRGVLTDSSGTSWLTVYTYLVDSEPIADSRRVQLLTALRSMYSRTTAGIIAVATQCMEKCQSRISDVEDAFIRVVETHQEEHSE